MGTDWEGSQSREPLSLWISSGNNEGNMIEYICEATLLSEGLATGKTTWAPLLYSGIHSDVPRSCHGEALPKAPNELKNVSVQEKNPLRMSYAVFYKEMHVLIVWFKEKKQGKKAQLVVGRDVFARRRQSMGNVASAINFEWNRKLTHTHWSEFLEEQAHFAIIFIMLPASPAPGISGCTSSAFLFSRCSFL